MLQFMWGKWRLLFNFCLLVCSELLLLGISSVKGSLMGGLCTSFIPSSSVSSNKRRTFFNQSVWLFFRPCNVFTGNLCRYDSTISLPQLHTNLYGLVVQWYSVDHENGKWNSDRKSLGIPTVG